MPRYRPKKTPPSYTVEVLKAACEAVASKRLTYRAAEELYKVNKSVIYQRLCGRKTSMNVIGGGRRPVFTEEIEIELENCILARAEWEYPVDREELLDLVQDYVTFNDIKTSFKNGRPGEDWYLNFMKRRKILSLKKPEQLQQKRADAADPFIVNDFYEKLDKIIRREGLRELPELVLNCDETGFGTDPSKVKAIGKKGSKSFYRRVAGTGRENISVNCCAAASGAVLPPHIIYKAKGSVQVRWTSQENEYPGTLYSTTENGYMEESVFYSWFNTLLVPYVESVRRNKGVRTKAVLIMDGHRSHISFRLVNAAVNSSIILLKLPSHLTHRMQPLDKCVFGPLKIGWEKILVNQGRRALLTSQNTINRKTFVELLAEAWRKYLPESNIISGFRETGCFPVDASKFPVGDYDQIKLERFKADQEKNKENELENKIPQNQIQDIQKMQDGQAIPFEKSTTQMKQTSPPANISTDSPNQEMNQGDTHSEPSTSVITENATQHQSQLQQPTTTDGRRSVMDLFINKLRKEFSPPIQKPTERQIRLKKDSYGEVLTSTQVLIRLKNEEERRNAKKIKKSRPKKFKRSEPKQLKKLLEPKCKKLKKNTCNEETLSDSENENEDLRREMETLPSSNDNSYSKFSDEESSDEHLNENNDTCDVLNTIEIESFYAVDFVSKWYIGKSIQTKDNSIIRMKFLERITHDKFRWPKREDIDDVDISAIFAPITIEENRDINKLSVRPSPATIEKIWGNYKKKNSLSLKILV